MNTSDTVEREPAEIEAGIARTRASLDRKIEEIEKRLDPRRQWAQARHRYETPVLAWAAVTAVAAGAWMAVSGLRRHSNGSDGYAYAEASFEPEMAVTEVTVCE